MYGILKSIGISSFDDFSKFDVAKLAELGIAEQQQKYIKDCIKNEIQDQKDNLVKRFEQRQNNGHRHEIDQVKIFIYKLDQVDANKHLHGNEERSYNLVKEILFTGLRDFVFCSSDVNELREYENQSEVVQVFVMDEDVQAKKLEFRIVYKKESVYMIT